MRLRQLCRAFNRFCRRVVQSSPLLCCFPSRVALVHRASLVSLRLHHGQPARIAGQAGREEAKAGGGALSATVLVCSPHRTISPPCPPRMTTPVPLLCPTCPQPPLPPICRRPATMSEYDRRRGRDPTRPTHPTRLTVPLPPRLSLRKKRAARLVVARARMAKSRSLASARVWRASSTPMALPRRRHARENPLHQS